MEASAKAQTVAGGTKFQTSTPIGKCFAAVLTYLKHQGHDIELADRDAGRIATVLTVTGNHSLTGTRILVTFVEDSHSQTSLRVVVTSQHCLRRGRIEQGVTPRGQSRKIKELRQSHRPETQEAPHYRALERCQAR
jgi:hypothetical protein